MANLAIRYQPPGALRPQSQNARTHTKKQIRQIAASIRQFGFTNPVLIDSRNHIIAGHGRVEAAKQLALENVPTIQLADMTEAEIRAYVIADNKLAENAGWDLDLLGIELQYLSNLDLDLDLTVTGFETAEIDLLISDPQTANDTDEPADEVAVVAASVPPISKLGDLWLIGNHRLICGDATDPTVYGRLLDGAQAQMIFTDPPYNVPIDRHVCGLGSVKHREFPMASGKMSSAAFGRFLSVTFRNLACNAVDGAIHFVCMDWRHMGEIIEAGRSAYDELKNLCVWAKTNGGMGSFYRSQHELVFVFKSGTDTHINNIELGKHGRNRSNLWRYAGLNTFSQDRDALLGMHPTVKPVSLVADAIFDCSNRHGIILDAFTGSGTTLLAAEQTGRRGYGIELDPRYVDVSLERLHTQNGLDAIHADTGMTFADLKKQRSSDPEYQPKPFDPDNRATPTHAEVRDAQ